MSARFVLMARWTIPMLTLLWILVWTLITLLNDTRPTPHHHHSTHFYSPPLSHFPTPSTITPSSSDWGAMDAKVLSHEDVTLCSLHQRLVVDTEQVWRRRGRVESRDVLRDLSARLPIVPVLRAPCVPRVRSGNGDENGVRRDGEKQEHEKGTNGLDHGNEKHANGLDQEDGKDTDVKESNHKDEKDASGHKHRNSIADQEDGKDTTRYRGDSGNEDDNEEENATLPPPIIVLGTAGTGTRVVYDLLAMSGVHMSRLVNSQRDSRVFIEFVKNHASFGKPTNGTEGEDEADLGPSSKTTTAAQTLMQWLGEHGSVNYDTHQLNNDTRSLLQEAWSKAQHILEYEAMLRRHQVQQQDTTAFRWGFKEPQAMFVLPFLLDSYINRTMKCLAKNSKTSQEPYEHLPPDNGSSCRLSIVHVVRDGRDVAFSKQQRKKYQNYYNHLLIPNDVNEDQIPLEWRYSLKVARVWQHVNMGLMQWAYRNQHLVKVVTVRLEDLCRPENRLGAAKYLLNELGLLMRSSWEDSSALDYIREERCHLQKFMHAEPILVETMTRIIRPGLEMFNYTTEISTETQSQPSTFSIPQDFFDTVERLPSTLDQAILYTFITKDYRHILLNWLLHWQFAKSISIPPIFIVTSDKDLEHWLYTTDTPISLPLVIYVIDSHLTENQNDTETGGFGKVDVWKWRMLLLQKLLEANRNVILMDVDAIVLNGQSLDFLPVSQNNQSSLVELSDGTRWQDFDIIASRGRFPYDLSQKWGATVCLGFVYFQSSTASKELMRRVMSLVLEFRDDQVSLNQALYMLFNPEWTIPSMSVNGVPVGDVMVGHGSLDATPIRVAVLPLSLVPRYCKDDIKRYQSEMDSQLTMPEDLGVLYPHARVLHCLTPKLEAAKKAWFERWGLWRVDMTPVDN